MHSSAGFPGTRLGGVAAALARPLSVLTCLVVVGLKLNLGGEVSATWRHWQGLQVQRFLITSKAAYDAFDPARHQAPAGQIDRFPAGTSGISVYYELSEATPGHTTVGLAVYGGRGQIGAYAPDVARSADFGMFEYLDMGAKLAPGAYRIDLLLDGRAIASRPFQVAGGRP